MKSTYLFLAAVTLFLSLGSLPQSASAAQERPRFDMPKQSTAHPEMLAPVDIVAGTKGPVGNVRRDPNDLRDGTRPEGMDRPRELTTQEKGYIRNAQKYAAEIGGDDNLFVDEPSELIADGSLAIAENGDMYYGYTRDSGDPLYAEYVVILRSTDGGETFSQWGQIGDNSGSNFARMLTLLLVEGDADRLYVQYMESFGLGLSVAYSELGTPAASWTIRTVFQESGVSFISGAMTSDVISFDSFYLYAAASGLDGNGDDIWYARSTDLGDTWSAPYRIASLSHDGDHMYHGPSIEYGFGGMVHVGWTYTGRLTATHDNGVRYRRATNYGGSISDWDATLWVLRSTTDGIGQACLDIAASSTDSTLVLANGEGGYGDINPRIMYVQTAGRTWAGYMSQNLPWYHMANIQIRQTDSMLMGSGVEYDGENQNLVLAHAPLAALDTWSTPNRFNDVDVPDLIYPALALDPSREYQAAVVFAKGLFYGTSNRYFDAEWRRDPGFPNYDTGFPVDLDPEPISAPAIVNIDGDPHGEIVFTTDDDMLQVYSHLGTVESGWPQSVPNLLFNSPVAVGGLDLTGDPFIVVGSSDGYVYAFDGNGNPREGFPLDLGTGLPTYVAIGAVGGPYPRMIVACSKDRIHFINHRGIIRDQSSELTGYLHFPPAIGDVDNDGVAEIVTLMGPVPGSGWYYLHVTQMGVHSPEMYRAFTSNSWSGAPTLFDLDLDGDLEIAAPTKEGELFVMHHDGTDVTGFPFNNGTGYPLTSAAAANNLGTSEPDLAVASQDFRVHLLLHDGSQQASYPKNTNIGWWNFAAPIVDRVNRISANIIIGTRGLRAWSFQNTGGIPGGWPKGLIDNCELSPASGDIDLDGSNEIVFLTQGQLVMVDVNYPPESDPGRKWPMNGYDPQRTGCLSCQEDLVSPTPQEGITRVSFAPPSPNPANGPTVFRYQIPSHATVNLEVFDIRGYRVRRIHRSEENSGSHVVHFDGLDQNGREMAAGQYFARLTVRGPGINEVKTRKLTLLK